MVKIIISVYYAIVHSFAGVAQSGNMLNTFTVRLMNFAPLNKLFVCQK